MAAKTESASLTLVRSVARGALLSIVFMYAVHVLGKWRVENYRPDPQTTGTVLLHNTCAVFGVVHTLRPNTDISSMGDGIDGTKLSGSFMNFFDGHAVALIVLSLLLGGGLFAIRNAVRKNRH